MKPLEILVDDLKSETITSQELVDQALASIKAKNHDIFALLEVYEDEARSQAKASDERRAEGKPLSDIDGVPVVLNASGQALVHSP